MCSKWPCNTIYSKCHKINNDNVIYTSETKEDTMVCFTFQNRFQLKQLTNYEVILRVPCTAAVTVPYPLDPYRTENHNHHTK